MTKIVRTDDFSSNSMHITFSQALIVRRGSYETATIERVKGSINIWWDSNTMHLIVEPIENEIDVIEKLPVG